MKPFQFRLKNFLKIKEFEEKNSWNEVLKQESRAFNIKNKIDNLNMTMQKSREERDQIGINPMMDQAHATLINESLTALEARGEALHKEYLVELKTLEKLKEIHSEKRKEAKILDKFKDRKKAEYKVDREKVEQKQSNEIAGNLYTRRDKKYG